jgi:hypothetical protein
MNLKIYSQSDIKLKNEAMQFSLEVVKTFFKKDINLYIEKVSDTLVSLNGKVYLKGKIKERLERIFKEAVKVKSKTFQDYQEFYKYEVLTIPELTTKFNYQAPKNSKLLSSDLCFFGGYKKESKKHLESFIWDDCFGFIVRKENGKWYVKGFGE